MARVLAVEIVGDDEDVSALREKARWYLAHGVETVWIVVPAARTVPESPALPGLSPLVADFFRQL